MKESICLRLREDCGVGMLPRKLPQPAVQKHSLYIALQCLLNPGDEVILPVPYWVSYIEMIRMSGGIPVMVEAGHEQDFKITPGTAGCCNHRQKPRRSF